MHSAWAQILNRLTFRSSPEDEVGIKNRRLTFFEEVEAARLDWLAAKAYFDTVSEPELVDHAIYLAEAAEKKYMYLLKLARERKLAASLEESASATGS